MRGFDNIPKETYLFFFESYGPNNKMQSLQSFFQIRSLEKPLRKSENGVGPMRQLCLKQKASEISSSLYSSN